MPTVRIISPISQAQAERDGLPRPSHGTRIFIGDQEVDEVRDIHMYWPVDGVVTCDFSCFPSELQDIIEDAHVNVTFVCLPEYSIIREQISEGRVRLSCVRNDRAFATGHDSVTGITAEYVDGDGNRITLADWLQYEWVDITQMQDAPTIRRFVRTGNDK